MLSAEDHTGSGTGEGGILDERPPPAYLVLEVARLAAVRSYGLFDRSDLPEFDGIAAAAARAFDCPLAGFGVLDEERVWFAGAYELPCREISRIGSLCEYAMAMSSPLTVRDASADPRFAAHSDVAMEGGLRFCAGVPVLDEDDYRVGTLCVFDREPGESKPAALTELFRLSAEASALLAARRRSLGRTPEPTNRVQGWLGVRTCSGRLRSRDHRPGLLVLGVAAESPAEAAGLRPTDILLSVDGQLLWHPPDLVSALAGRPRESLAHLQVIRGGHVIDRVVPILPEPARTHLPAL